ncbi:hypothetical protein, conserved [Plasmodium gonderi]|uniref:Alpha/beta hydrolase n=1 Tax=Plasmodium gonderi TaxID=77519 RepID=A0A1Y1JPZ4_PLAGO|nr:hypothetical protein, conserved [Plasmodium gonderi]GAW82503.1 hypothetical protein, conserved [Plasmodium gonderi]
MSTIMFCKKMFKSLKKNSSCIVFFLTVLYLYYTYISLFLSVLNNTLFYLFVNILLFYICFNFVVRALTYPGSLFIYFHKTNYDNKVELCKFYMKESVKLSLIISELRINVKEILKCENEPNRNLKIKLEQLFSSSNNKDNYFNFFSSLYIFYTLYISYYLYVNLEENVDFTDEQLNFYYYLKIFMIKINELKIYIHQDDILYPEMLTEISIHKDINKTVHEFISKKNTTYRQFYENIIEKERDTNLQYPRWIFNVWKYISNKKNENECKIPEERMKLISEKVNEKIHSDLSSTYNNLFHRRNGNRKEEGLISSYSEEYKKMCNISNYNIKSEDHNLKNKENSTNEMHSNYVDINILSLFHHENYEKSITHVNYKNFFMIIQCENVLKLLDDLTFFLNKLGELFKLNSLKESIDIKKLPIYINNYIKNHIAGTLDLFKYELIYKYYGKQEYLVINKEKLDCMFIPCKKFLSDKMQKYMKLIKTIGKKGLYDMYNMNTHCNSYIYLNAFNNDFYNFIYHDDYLHDIPVVLYFNPNAAYYELNACYSESLKFYIENNMNVFVYNYRGYSKSSGYPNLNRNNLDALKIAEYLLSKKIKHLGLHGTSIGGPLCSYVSYHLCNFNEQNKNSEILGKLYKNEAHMKITNKQINKTVRLMNRKKDKILNILLIPFKYIILLLHFIILCKLKVTNIRIKRKINMNNRKKKKLRINGDKLNNGSDDNNRNNNNDSNYCNNSNNCENVQKPKISFVCIDKSFYNFEEVAKYMLGEYAYNILQFTSYKLDITKYYMSSNVPKILIYDNNDEIIHYMSNVVTGVSKGISKLYKSDQGKVGCTKDFSENEENLLPLITSCCDDEMDAERDDLAMAQKMIYHNLCTNEKNQDEKKQTELHKRNGQEVEEETEHYKKRIFFKSPNENMTFVDHLIIDENVDKCWFDNKLKKLDMELFLQSWKVLNDCILFLNKSSTTNNSFISIGLETYKFIMSLYNYKEHNLEKQTHNAIYCIYNDNISFMNKFKKVNCNYEDFLMSESMYKERCSTKDNIYDMLQENEDFIFEMDKLDKILKDLYMSKRKEVEKVHFTYSGFFLKNDYLYNYINTKNRKKDDPAFNIEDMDIINFLNEFSDSITEIVNTVNYNLNSCGQLFSELNNVLEKEKICFLKSFIFRMKVYGSYPSQCFLSSYEQQYCNSIYQIPFILSQCFDQGDLNGRTKMKNDKHCFINKEGSDEPLSDGEYSNSDCENVYFLRTNLEKRTIKIKGKRNKDDFQLNNKCTQDFNCSMFPPYVIVKKSMFLHDLIICLNYFKKDGGSSFGSLNVFYKLEENTYIIDIKQLYHALEEKNKDNTILLKSRNFLHIFSNDVGININNANLSNELEKYVSWMRLNNRMSVCKIYLTLKNELQKMKNYSKSLATEYTSINQNTSIHFIIFLIYRILIFKKLLTHTYIIYTFFERLTKSLDVNVNCHDYHSTNIDLTTLVPISRFDVSYREAYKVYSPKVLGCPLLVNCGHNGSMNKENLDFFGLCLDFYLKEYI